MLATPKLTERPKAPDKSTKYSATVNAQAGILDAKAAESYVDGSDLLLKYLPLIALINCHLVPLFVVAEIDVVPLRVLFSLPFGGNDFLRC
jgi:hypothetical protein